MTVGSEIRPGSLLLVETTGGGDTVSVAGLVERVVDERTLLVDLTSQPRLTDLPCRVTVGVYTAEAYLRGDGTASAVSGNDQLVEVVLTDVTRTNRHERRVATRLPVGVVGFDHAGQLRAVAGETLDVSAGGCRVVCPVPVAAEGGVAVLFAAGDEPVVVAGSVKGEIACPDGYECRIAFRGFAADDAQRLERLIR